MSSNNIPFIHNYCDRWCERCTFTSRCAVFESEADAKPEELDIKNKAFWQRLSSNFAKANKLLEQAASQHGIDIEKIKQDIASTEKEIADRKEEASKNPTLILAKEYTTFALDWLKTQPGMLEKLEQLKEELTIGVQNEQQAKQLTLMIKESLAVIQWYATLIQTKIYRAVSGKLNAAMWEEEEDDVRDYDGSAKIAIISIERSMQAWSSLFDFLSEQEDEFLKALSMLEKMKAGLLNQFPAAMSFVRPGFDEGH
jgi:hypothetical protein